MTDSFKRLFDLTQSQELLAGGIISGTSRDAINCCVCRITKDSVHLEEFWKGDYSEESKVLLSRCLNLKTGEISRLNFLIGRDFAQAFLKRQNIQVDVIGCHGQTLYHHSGLDPFKHTLQVGIGEFLAEALGCFVVCDFRYRDIILGGEGAPLSPYGDYRIFPKDKRPLLILNIGGISNYTYLGSSFDDIQGFDCGPGNILIDTSVRKFNLSPSGIDDQGNLGRKGECKEELLKFLLEIDDYFSQPPPKSAGFERFGDELLEAAIKAFPNIQPLDFLRTIYEYTVQGIVSGFSFAPKTDLLVLAGGGVKNNFLVDLIKSKLTGVEVVIPDVLGIPAEARESMIFAVLAADFIWQQTTNVPKVTGAQKRAPLGRLIIP